MSHVLKCAALPENIHRQQWLVGLIACLTCQRLIFLTIYLQIGSKRSNEKCLCLYLYEPPLNSSYTLWTILWHCPRPRTSKHLCTHLVYAEVGLLCIKLTVYVFTGSTLKAWTPLPIDIRPVTHQNCRILGFKLYEPHEKRSACSQEHVLKSRI